MRADVRTDAAWVGALSSSLSYVYGAKHFSNNLEVLKDTKCARLNFKMAYETS